MADLKRKFRGIWIPRETWLNKGLSLAEKALLAEIDSLDSNDKGCYASNEYFASFFQLNERQIRRHISSLAKKGYIVISNPKSKKRSIQISGAKPFNFDFFNPDRNVLVHRTKMSDELGQKRPTNNILDNKERNTAPASPSAVVVNSFDFKRYIQEMLNDHNEHVQIVGVFADEMFEANRIMPWQTIHQAKEFIARNLRVAKKLTAYSPYQIRSTIQHLLNYRIKERPIDFSLETVLAWIDKPEVYGTNHSFK